MVTLFKNSLEVIRRAPLTSSFDLPWQILEHYGMNEKSVLPAKYDPSPDAIQQTIGRLFASLVTIYIPQPLIIVNGSLGGIHLLYCLRYIQQIQDNPNQQAELEHVLIRLITVIYDLSLMILLPRTFRGYKVFQIAFHLIYTFFPDLTRQIHESIFNHKDFKTLEEGCLIKQLAKGVADTVLGHGNRLKAFPNAILNIHSPQKKPKPTNFAAQPLAGYTSQFPPQSGTRPPAPPFGNSSPSAPPPSPPYHQ